MIRRFYAFCACAGLFARRSAFELRPFSFSNGQLNQIFTTYNQFSSIDIEAAIKVHFEGALYYLYMAIGRTCSSVSPVRLIFSSAILVRVIRNRSRFFAYELKKSIRVS